MQRAALDLDFDPCDVPADRLPVAGEVRRGCRSGRIDPDRCGILDMHGLWFVRGNLVRDLAALNKIELLPWAGWGITEKDEAGLTADDRPLLDEVASLTAAPSSAAFVRLRALFEQDDRLRVPRVIRSYGSGSPQPVGLGLEG